MGQELSRCVKLILAKAVSEALAWAGEGSAVPSSVSQGPYGTRPETTEEQLPVPCTALCETVLLCHCDLSPGLPAPPFSLLGALLPPPSCCEAPHSFPHSHFHFPALGFASTLSSTSFAQMTSNKTNRDAPIRLYSWCRNEAMRDRGVLCLLIICFRNMSPVW